MVEADRLLGPDRVGPGDVVIAMASSGLHSNGYSLVRQVLSQAGGALDLDAVPPGLGQPLGEELLTPTRIYARDCLALAEDCDVHAFAHVTGGGLALNLARVLPPHADAVLDRATWRPQPVFGLLAEQRRHRRRRRWSGSSTWASAWWPWSARTTPTRRSACWRRGACPRGWPAR